MDAVPHFAPKPAAARTTIKVCYVVGMRSGGVGTEICAASPVRSANVPAPAIFVSIEIDTRSFAAAAVDDGGITRD